MQKYILHAHLFLLFMWCSVAQAADPVKALFENRPWYFVEQVFILESQKELETFTQNAKRWIPSLIAGTTSGIVVSSLAECVLPEQSHSFRLKQYTQTVGASLVSIMSISTIYTFIRAYSERTIDLRVLTAFISEWQDNKRYTPTEWHASCDALFDLYSTDGETASFQEVAIKISPVLKRTIYEQFPERYADQLKNMEYKSVFDRMLSTAFSVKLDLAHIFDVLVRTVCWCYR